MNRRVFLQSSTAAVASMSISRPARPQSIVWAVAMDNAGLANPGAIPNMPADLSYSGLFHYRWAAGVPAASSTVIWHNPSASFTNSVVVFHSPTPNGPGAVLAIDLFGADPSSYAYVQADISQYCDGLWHEGIVGFDAIADSYFIIVDGNLLQIASSIAGATAGVDYQGPSWVGYNGLPGNFVGDLAELEAYAGLDISQLTKQQLIGTFNDPATGAPLGPFDGGPGPRINGVPPQVALGGNAPIFPVNPAAGTANLLTFIPDPACAFAVSGTLVTASSDPWGNGIAAAAVDPPAASATPMALARPVVFAKPPPVVR
jgi:hypothetical protein